MKKCVSDFVEMPDFLAVLRRDEPELFREPVSLVVRSTDGLKNGFRVSQLPDGTRLVEASAFGAARRGVGSALAGILGEEHSDFRTQGVMVDVSRNMVLREEYLKRWLRHLALCGYNLLMLYTEDTYDLPGEPFWGYMRGRYSAEMIRRLDAYAKTLGIELVGCIQTLGHLEQVIRCTMPMGMLRIRVRCCWRMSRAPMSRSAKCWTSGAPRCRGAGFMSAWMKRTIWDAGNSLTDSDIAPVLRYSTSI